MFGSGDNGLILKQTGVIFVLLFIILVAAFWFGIVQFGNGKDHRFDNRVCSYSYRSVLGWSWVRINLPDSFFPVECHYAR
jgi:hypothetical protein